MRIAYIAAGAAGMYCGNCLRDHALAVAAKKLGTDITLVPTYTPLRTDLPQGEETARDRLFFNGIRAWLEQKLPYFRKPRPVLDRVLGSRPMVALLSRLEMSTDPARLGEMTESMLRGADGFQQRELYPLIDWLRKDLRPDLVHLSNALLLGMAAPLREALNVPVTCSLQSEDIFLEGLVEPWRTRCFELIHAHAKQADGRVAISAYYADWCAEHLGIARETIEVVESGIHLDGHHARTFRDPAGSPVVGFLARFAPEKGLDILCDAFADLASRPQWRGARLRVAGYFPAGSLGWVASLRRRLTARGIGDRVEFLGTVDRVEKLAFLQSIDVLAVPTRHPEPKGLFVLEAMASGLPIVVPRHGVFPELLEATGAGVLVPPGEAESLANALDELLADADRLSTLGERGRQAALSRFSAERMATETTSFWERALVGSRAPGNRSAT